MKVGDLVAYKARVGLETGFIKAIYRSQYGKEYVEIDTDSYDSVKVAKKTVVKIYDSVDK